MALIKWIHISDIHIKSAGEHLEKYNSEIVLKSLWKDISNRSRINQELAELDFVFITGDLAWSGADLDSTDEYDQVYERLIKPLSEHAGININRIFLVPGNHDVARSKIDDEVKTLESTLSTRDSISELFVDPKWDEKRAKVFSRLEAYTKLMTKRFNHLPVDPISLTYSKTIPEAGSKPQIKVVGLNSAWLARGGKEDKESIALGEPIVKQLLNSEKDTPCLTIALVHHPLSYIWYKKCEMSTLQTLKANADFLLAGHVHQSDVTSFFRVTGSCVEIVGGSIYDGNRWSTNSYNYVCFDTEKLMGYVYLRRYCDNAPLEPEWQPDLISTGKEKMGVLPIQIIRDAPGHLESYSASESLRMLVTEQRKELGMRPLLAQSHPERDSMSVLFPDVYIEPLVKPRRNPLDTPIPLSEWMQTHGESTNKVLLVGSAGTGKTTALIGLHHQSAYKFLAGVTEHVPIFIEAQNLNWEHSPSVESVALTVMAHFNQPQLGQVLKDVAPDKLRLFLDGVDEAFPSAYQEMDVFDPLRVRLDIPHVMTCRTDFFLRNLSSANFCMQYDEILDMESWTINREVPEFVDKYYKHIHATIDTEKRAELLRVIGDFAESPGMHLTPLVVTTILFLWRYDYDQTVRNLPKTFASLIGRFIRIWAEREVDTKACIFKNADELLHAYEEAAWFFYNNRRPKIEDLAKALCNKIGVSWHVIVQERGILSILRTGRVGASEQETYVISFVHQAIYEYLLAQRLRDSLRGRTTDTEIIGRLLGHSINGLARQLLSTSLDEERSDIVHYLQREYEALSRISYGITGKIMHYVRCFLHGQNAAIQYAKNNIIRRHNICYFWGRLESDMDGTLMRRLFEQILDGSVTEHEIVCTTVGSCILLMNEARLERAYLDRLSDGGSWDISNRTYHRVYYGDAGYADPDTFISDDFQEGCDDWPKTRQAILTRLNSCEERAIKLRSLDLVTFRRFCQTRGIPALNADQIAVLENCINTPNGLSKERIVVLKEEHVRLMVLFAKTKGTCDKNR